MTDGPHHGQNSTGPAARAADPNTPQVQLHMLAGDHPELRPLIAENPNTYPELLQWLAGLDDPAVDAALARRSAAGHGQSVDAQATSMLPAADQASDTGEEQFSAVRQDRPEDYAPQTAAVPVNPPGGYEDDYAQPRAGYYPSAPPAGAAPWQAPAQPASYPYEREEEPRRKSGGTCAIVFLIILLAVAAVVAAYFLIFGGVFSSDTDENADEVSQEQVQEDPAEAEDPGAEAEASPGEATTEDENADSEDAVRPAPDGAEDIPSFTAPSGNINCAMDENSLECSILDYSFDTPEDCEGAAQFSVAEGEPEIGCGTAPGAESATLQYGQAATNGRFACVSSESGFECWNTETGNGFFVARASYQLQN